VFTQVRGHFRCPPPTASTRNFLFLVARMSRELVFGQFPGFARATREPRSRQQNADAARYASGCPRKDRHLAAVGLVCLPAPVLLGPYDLISFVHDFDEGVETRVLGEATGVHEVVRRPSQVLDERDPTGGAVSVHSDARAARIHCGLAEDADEGHVAAG